MAAARGPVARRGACGHRRRQLRTRPPAAARPVGDRRPHLGGAGAAPHGRPARQLGAPESENPNLPIKRVFLPGAELGLTGELLLWAKEQGVADHEPLFFSRKRDADGSRRAVQRGQAWLIVKEASERANVRVLALRTSKHGPVGEATPVHPHLFRHARVRQIVRSTRNLPLAQRQAGWSRLQMAYLTVGDEEARRLMQDVPE